MEAVVVRKCLKTGVGWEIRGQTYVFSSILFWNWQVVTSQNEIIAWTHWFESRDVFHLIFLFIQEYR